MALALAYVNEVLNHVPSTVVVEEEDWPGLVAALKFEGRDLESCVIGRMSLRHFIGGYDGLLSKLSKATNDLENLQRERNLLADQVISLEAQVSNLREELEALMKSTVNKV